MEKQGDFQYEYFSSVTQHKVEWLWYPYIPYGKLFILDPLQGYLSQESDMTNAGRMRSQLKRLADIASRHRCAVVIVGHMNKASGEKHLYRGLGSIDIAAIARSVLMISRDKENPTIRYMFPVKSSLAPEGAAIAFSLSGMLGFCWMGQRDIDTNKLSAYSLDDSKKTLAMRVIQDMLADHDVLSTDIVKKLKLMDVSERTMNKAKKEIGIVSYRKRGVWYWHLPEPADNEFREDD